MTNPMERVGSVTRRDFMKVIGLGALATVAPFGCRSESIDGASKDYTPAYGIVPPLLTPFTEDGSIDYPAYDRLIDWHVARGVTGVFIICSSSESAHLTEPEALKMADAAVRRANDRINILAGSSLHSSLAENIAMTRRMADTGVDGCFITTPRFLPEDGRSLGERMLEYYTSIHDAVQCPVYGYEIPGVYHFEPEVAASLGKLDRFIGIKDTSTRGDIPPAEAIAPVEAKLAATNGTVKIMQANTARVLDSFIIGCTGAINQVANVASSLLVKLHELWEAGEMEQARALQLKINEIDRIEHEGFVMSAKMGLAAMGFDIGPTCRSQKGEYTRISGEEMQRMADLIQRAEDEFEIKRFG
jgi:4-hydroxy-tetrahydrodipicolinate synthase